MGVQEPVRALFDRYDVDASNTMAYQEFAALAVGAKPNPTASAESRSAIHQVRAGVAARGGLNGIRSLGHIFRQMDASGNRLLDFDELRAGLADLGVELSDHDFRTVCRIFDTNGDGLVRRRWAASRDAHAAASAHLHTPTALPLPPRRSRSTNSCAPCAGA